VKDCRRISEGLYEECTKMFCCYFNVICDNRGRGKKRCTSMLVSCHQIAGQRFMKNVDVASFRYVGVIQCVNIIFLKRLKKKQANVVNRLLPLSYIVPFAI
jgi:hypothetical protein